MHLQVTLSVPTDPRTAGTMLADPDYVRAKVRASGADDLHVDVTPGDAGAFTVTTRRALPTDLIPPNIRAFVGSTLEVRQAEAWEGPQEDGARRGTVAVEIAGAPVRLTGTVALTGGPGGSTITYEGELKAHVPLFGATVEQAAAGAVRGALEAEEAVARAWVEDSAQA
ncbi:MULTISPECIES: DUF2505 domain-containing protein [unclassified Cellulomonas]|uniref:DUF2505 domain-containing protein n=1 Tax=unclassified Cellulomonas TaxID=2620175 RepID=UPI0019C7267A|nr:DUF2505 domain-containing protein [Cellulomonas sp. ES6]MBD3780047.1 DUF2505 domain-containing protein [Micrococcales bacterium]WHP17173.1 DUF2505 domain-containing protein [Cellulomonas sp. ES6]